jgi:Pectate lyase superfamily protein
MALESATYISGLNSLYPETGDAKTEGDDHLRLIKSTLLATFPNITGAVTPTHTAINETASFLQSGSGAVTRTGRDKMREIFSVKDFGATGDGSTDDATAIQAAIDAAAGKPVFFPAGTYRINTALTYITTSTDVFTPGLKLIGDGSGKTILDSRVASAALIRVDTNAVATARFQRGVQIVGMTISGEYGNPASAIGLSFRHAYNVLLDDVYVKNFTLDGVKVILNEGDTDGCNNFTMRNCRMEACGQWGFNHEVTGAFNEFSFFNFLESSITACGTASATTPPPSGGMRWKGQLATLERSYISECENCGLFVQGGSGLPLGITLRNFTLENNKKVQLYCTGIDGLIIDALDMRNNNSFVATSGILLDATSYTIRGVDIQNVVVKATTSNNPITAFNAAGANGESITIGQVVWNTFDTTGQTRYSTNLYAFTQPNLSDDSREIFRPREIVSTSYSSSNPTYTANRLLGETHFVKLTAGATGTLTIANPTFTGMLAPTLHGSRFRLLISNTSGGAITLAFTIGTRSAPASIANGADTQCEWIYDSAVGWVQFGVWG